MLGISKCDWFVPFEEEWEWDKIISILKAWGYVWEVQTGGVFKGVDPHWIDWNCRYKFIGVCEDLKVISWWHSLIVEGVKTLDELIVLDRDKKICELC